MCIAKNSFGDRSDRRESWSRAFSSPRTSSFHTTEPSGICSKRSYSRFTGGALYHKFYRTYVRYRCPRGKRLRQREFRRRLPSRKPSVFGAKRRPVLSCAEREAFSHDQGNRDVRLLFLAPHQGLAATKQYTTTRRPEPASLIQPFFSSPSLRRTTVSEVPVLVHYPKTGTSNMNSVRYCPSLTDLRQEPCNTTLPDRATLA